MAKSKVKASSKPKSKKKPSSKSSHTIAALESEVNRLRKEIDEKNSVLQSYADHRNWGKPTEVRERLGIPEKDISGRPIDDPTQCFLGSRYPWEPALKVLLGMGEAAQTTSES